MANNITMTSSKPHLLRAMFDWILESDCTPHLVVDVHVEGVSVPMEFVQDGRIVLNIAPRATKDFLMDGDGVSFNTRFSGVPHSVFAPIDAIEGIYARENGEGMMFEQEVMDNSKSASKPTNNQTRQPEKRTRPALEAVSDDGSAGHRSVDVDNLVSADRSKKPSLELVK